MEQLEALRAAYDAAREKMKTEMGRALEGENAHRSPAQIRKEASEALTSLVDTFDGALVRRLGAAMQVVVNLDVPGNLDAWYVKLDESWARKVVARGSSLVLDKALELIESAGRSVEEEWVWEPAVPEEPAAPAEEPAAPAEEPAAPAEEPAAPAEEPAAPVEEPAAPAEEPAAPVEEP